MAGNTAFQMITTRQSNYAATAIDRYLAVELSDTGKLVKATGALPFMGLVEYGAEAADEMVTFVRGVFPGLATEDIVAGERLVIDSTAPGKFKKASTGQLVVGVALTDATEGSTLSVMTLETAYTEA